MTGQTLKFTARRDVLQRERDSRGQPQVFTTWLGRRRLY